MTHGFVSRHLAWALLAALAFAGNALAQQPGPPLSARWDVALEMPMWPALQDLQPNAGGTFDSMGLGIGGSWHVPVAQYANSDMLVGIDGWIAATDSNIPGRIGDVLARHLYLGLSAKWLFGDSRNVSLDAGIGYHEVDIAQVDTEWYGTLEHEHWTSSRGGAFVGATWDVGAGRAEHNSGLSLGLRVHFVDFGSVHDRGSLLTPAVLGPDAGVLDGPLYMVRIAYSGR